MKIRTNYVSNSSSSSFLVGKDVSDLVQCIKLTEDIWKAIEKNFVDYNGKKINLSDKSNEWWLTVMVNDSSETYTKLSEIKNCYSYLDGHDEPYGWYDNETGYTVFKKDFNEYYIDNNDLFGKNKEDIPDVVELRDKCNKVLKSSKLNKTQKINAMKHIFNF